MRILATIILCALSTVALADWRGEFDDSWLTAQVFTPKSESGLVGWWDASKLTGLTNAQTVTNWLDISGLTNNVTETTSPPTYVSNAVNGKPSVRFLLSRLIAAQSASLDFDGDMTLFLVAYLEDSTSDGMGFIVNKQKYSPMTGWLVLQAGPWIENASAQVYGGGSYYQADFIGLTTNAWHVLTMHVSGTTLSSRIDGTNITTTTDVTMTHSSTPLTFGIDSDQPTDWSYRALNGELAEVILYNKAVSSGGISAVENYLKNKYGL